MAKTQYRTSLDSSVYIDPAGAEQDKREIDKAIAEIDKALNLLNPFNLDNSLFQGNTFEMTRDMFDDTAKRLRKQRERCVEIRNEITRIVNHYVTLDREIQRRMSEVFGNG